MAWSKMLIMLTGIKVSKLQMVSLKSHMIPLKSQRFYRYAKDSSKTNAKFPLQTSFMRKSNFRRNQTQSFLKWFCFVLSVFKSNMLYMMKIHLSNE